MPKKPAKKKPDYKTSFIHFCSSCAAVALLLLSAYNLNGYLSPQKILGAQADVLGIENEKGFWEAIVVEHPTYRDGWIQIAKLAHELGDENYAAGAYNTAKSIDPNSTELIKLAQEIGLK